MNKLEEIFEYLLSNGYSRSEDVFTRIISQERRMVVNGQDFSRPSQHTIKITYMGEGEILDESVEGTPLYEFAIAIDDDERCVECVTDLDDFRSRGL